MLDPVHQHDVTLSDLDQGHLDARRPHHPRASQPVPAVGDHDEACWPNARYFGTRADSTTCATAVLHVALEPCPRYGRAGNGRVITVERARFRCDCAVMARRLKHPTFAEIVTETRQAPKSRPRARPGLRPDGTLVNQEGHIYQQARAELSPADAHHAVRQGAALVWDVCGYSNPTPGCEVVWFTQQQRDSLKNARPPTLQNDEGHLAELGEWTSADGAVLIRAAGEVTWGELMP